jgi:hypothetical protein
MGELFNRDMVLTVGTIEIPLRYVDPKTDAVTKSLRAMFEVTKTTDPAPNEAKITIFNLNPSHRKAIQAGEKEWPVIIDAGYSNNLQRIFSGQLQTGEPRKEGTTWTTEIFAKDGHLNYGTARLNKSYGAGTPLGTVLEDAATALGVGAGNSKTKFANPLRPLPSFGKGVVVKGRVVDTLDKYVTSAGFQWSIQDGQLLVLGPNEVESESVVVLSQETGLIGTPEIGEKGTIKAVSLLRGSFNPGTKFEMRSREVTGFYKADKIVHIGDSGGPPWYTETEGKPLQGAA